MSGQEVKNPHDLLTREILHAAVKKDLGSQWELASFEIKDFTNKGDNFSCKVTSAWCKAVANNEEKRTSYVAKLNPQYRHDELEIIMREIFKRESGFLSEAGVILNKILEEIYQPTINVPKCLIYDLKEKNQLLVLEDLRLKNFKMFDRKIGMDCAHASLVVKELAKIHAASTIFKGRLVGETVLERYPFLIDAFLNEDSSIREMFDKMTTANIVTSQSLLERVEGYEKHYKWLESIKSSLMDLYCEAITSGSDDMKVICHGDCWNNNIQFRYDDCGNPIDIYLVDLQMCRYGSFGLDLTYFFFTSLTGEVRNKHLDQLFSTYYEQFAKIMKAANKPMKFTEEDVLKEYKSKATYGIMSGLAILPLIISEAADIPEFEQLSKEEYDNFEKQYTELIFKTADKDPMFKSRFLALFDDASKLGVMKD